MSMDAISQGSHCRRYYFQDRRFRVHNSVTCFFIHCTLQVDMFFLFNTHIYNGDALVLICIFLTIKVISYGKRIPTHINGQVKQIIVMMIMALFFLMQLSLSIFLNNYFVWLKARYAISVMNLVLVRSYYNISM